MPQNNSDNNPVVTKTTSGEVIKSATPSQPKTPPAPKK